MMKRLLTILSAALTAGAVSAAAPQQLIDIRTPAEFERGALPGFRNIPLDELRERLNELDPALPVRLVCQSGLRSYVAARMLAGHGFAGVSHLAGGLRFYDIVTADASLIERSTTCGADAC